VNLRLYMRVLRRFWLIVALGLVLAFALAFASLAKVSFAHGSLSASYRQQEVWQSTTRLLVTQKGFPWGRLVVPTTTSQSAATTGEPSSPSLQFADPTRLEGLAVLYAQLINGNPIQQQIRSVDARKNALVATAVTDPTTGSLLPLIDVVGRGDSRREAVRVSQAGAALFRTYIADQQASADIARNQRVLLQVVSDQVNLAAGRKKTLAAVAFLAVMIATVGLALVLENLRPAVDVPESAAPKQSLPERNVA
jgi:hypothetical protein